MKPPKLYETAPIALDMRTATRYDLASPVWWMLWWSTINAQSQPLPAPRKDGRS